MIPALILPKEYRFDFARPRGPVIRGDFTGALRAWGPPSVVCVGDYVSRYCERLDPPLLMLAVDGKTRRSTRLSLPEPEGFTVLRLYNPPGGVTLPSMRALCSALQDGRGRFLVVVDGEEDMLALPSIACSPQGGVVVYGVPGRGAAIIRITRLARWEAWQRLLLLKPGWRG